MLSCRTAVATAMRRRDPLPLRAEWLRMLKEILTSLARRSFADDWLISQYGRIVELIDILTRARRHAPPAIALNQFDARRPTSAE